MKRLLIVALLLAGCSKPKPPATSTGVYSQFTPSFCGDYDHNTTWSVGTDGACHAEDDPAVTSNAPFVSNSPEFPCVTYVDILGTEHPCPTPMAGQRPCFVDTITSGIQVCPPDVGYVFPNPNVDVNAPPCIASDPACITTVDGGQTTSSFVGGADDPAVITTKALIDCRGGDAYWYVKFANGREMYGCGSVGTTIELEETK